MRAALLLLCLVVGIPKVAEKERPGVRARAKMPRVGILRTATNVRSASNVSSGRTPPIIRDAGLGGPAPQVLVHRTARVRIRRPLRWFSFSCGLSFACLDAADDKVMGGPAVLTFWTPQATNLDRRISTSMPARPRSSWEVFVNYQPVPLL